MWDCKNCGSHIIICNNKVFNTESGNSVHLDDRFGRIKMAIEFCWCADCGTIYNINNYWIENKNKEVSYAKKSSNKIN